MSTLKTNMAERNIIPDIMIKNIKMKQIIFYQMKQKKENLIEKEDKGIWLTLKYIE